MARPRKDPNRRLSGHVHPDEIDPATGLVRKSPRARYQAGPPVVNGRDVPPSKRTTPPKARSRRQMERDAADLDRAGMALVYELVYANPRRLSDGERDLLRGGRHMDDATMARLERGIPPWQQMEQAQGATDDELTAFSEQERGLLAEADALGLLADVEPEQWPYRAMWLCLHPTAEMLAALGLRETLRQTWTRRRQQAG